jgi:hypothetical protein
MHPFYIALIGMLAVAILSLILIKIGEYIENRQQQKH